MSERLTGTVVTWAFRIDEGGAGDRCFALDDRSSCEPQDLLRACRAVMVANPLPPSQQQAGDVSAVAVGGAQD